MIVDALRDLDLDRAGRDMYELVRRLYPIARSITGDGVRETLSILKAQIPIEVVEVPSGTPVLDWEVPQEWNVREAWVRRSNGETVLDWADSNLHLLGYSVPVHERLDRATLDEHLHSLPEQPDLIPYRTSYYKERWGFCLPHRQRAQLPEDTYEVRIDSTLADGHLTFGELHLPGEGDGETLISCHVCHPSLANDNLSGLAVVTTLAEVLTRCRRRRGYRFLFVPGTIGAITWLALNRDRTDSIDAGLVAANLGDGGTMHYKRSWQGKALIDRAVIRAFADAERHLKVEDFVPYGYDERQYSSPGFRLPVGSLTRTPYGRYPEYHTSADDLDLVRPEALADSLAAYLSVVQILESADRRPISTNPHGEPRLGDRGLYRTTGGSDAGRERELSLLWVLNLADGEHDLLSIAERSGLAFATVEAAATELRDAGLLTDGA